MVRDGRARQENAVERDLQRPSGCEDVDALERVPWMDEYRSVFLVELICGGKVNLD